MKRSILISLTTTAVVVCLASFGYSEKTDKASKKSSPVAIKAQSVSTAKLPQILDLGSKSCIPCKAMAPILDSLRQEFKGKAEVSFIDIKEDRAAATKHKITLIPTQIFFDSSGTEVFRHIGFFPADSITIHLKQAGAKL